MRCPHRIVIVVASVALLAVFSHSAFAQALGSSSSEGYEGEDSGGGGFGGGYGGDGWYGGGSGGMMAMGSGMQPVSPQMQILVKDSNGEEKKLTSDTVQVFRYEFGSLRPRLRPMPSGGMSRMMMGGGGMGYMADMMGAPGMMGDMGAGALGGDSEYGSYEDEGGYGGMEMSGDSRTKRISIHAFIFEVDDGRDKIELVVPFYDIGKVSNKLRVRDGAEVAAAIQSPGGPNGYAMFTTLSQRLDLMPEAESKLVGSMIRQSIWKSKAIEDLNQVKNQPAEVAKVEVELRQLLTEEYDIQLARQELEITGIEQRIRALRDELERRKAAKSRVVDVQLGNIVLEAQGLLGK